jgi:PAS domain S-box-containing protein
MEEPETFPCADPVLTVPASPATELSESIQAELALSRLAAIVESSDDAIISKDLRGIITSWNQSAERIFGYRADEVIGRPITIIIPPELRDDEGRILAKIASGERVDHFQTVRMRKDGERFDVSLTVSPVKDRNGIIVGAAKILRDVTQQKKLEAALHVTEKLASAGRLAATIAHEINNPLEAVTNFIYLVRLDPGLAEKSKYYLETADQELARVAHLVRQTLGFYRDPSYPVLLDIATVVQDVLTIYERKLLYNGLTVVQQIEPGLIVSAMKGELKQILSNLIANAMDASQHGGRILITAHKCCHHPSGQKGFRITVADTGTGIDVRVRKKLFDPFFTTKKELGTGLGLWITKDLLEKRGGNIRFRSRVTAPTGTVMTIYLPML